MPPRRPRRHRAAETRRAWPTPEYALLVGTLLAGIMLAALAVGRHLRMFLSAAPGSLG